jgi:hypothetical protein
MARVWADVERNMQLLNTLLAEVNMSIEQVISAYPDSDFLFRLLGLSDSWTDSDREALEERISGTRRHRNHRDPRTYVADLILGWVMQDAVIQLLRNVGYSCEPAGADAERRLLPGRQISEEADLMLTTPAGEV